MRMGLIIAVLVGIGGSALAQDRTITITGSGVVHAAPDMAVISLGASHQSDNADAAMQAVNDAVQLILAELQAAGIAGRDIQTSGLSLNPVRDHKAYENGGAKLIGFAASNRLTVRVRDLQKVGNLLGALVSVGANDIDGIRFDLQDPVPIQNEARVLAVSDAQNRAALFAEAAGVALGRVVTIQEGRAQGPRPEMMRTAAMADSVPVAAGELGVSAQVTIVWELVD